MEEVVIVDGIRTPIGAFSGSLKDVSAKDLAKTVMGELVNRTELDPSLIDEIIVGCASQPTNAPNLGRIAALELGFPKEIPAYVTNRNCASGTQAIVNAVQSIKAGDSDIHLVVGSENMSQIPFILRGARDGFRMRHQQLIDSLWEMLEDPVVNMMMGETAEVVAEEVGITREEQDRFALRSHERALKAREAGFFEREIVPVKYKDYRGREKEVSKDDEPNPDLSLETLSRMKPVFKKGGTVTVGNACSTNDAAAALMVMSKTKAQELGYQPKARIVSSAFVGLEPERMGLGPAYAVPKALEKANLSIEDIDLFELNEAFSAQALACMKLLKVDEEKVNIHGGAIALGHPVGATGVRLVLTLMNALEKEKKRYGVATLCIGGGLGGAIVIENLTI